MAVKIISCTLAVLLKNRLGHASVQRMFRSKEDTTPYLLMPKYQPIRRSFVFY